MLKVSHCAARSVGLLLLVAFDLPAQARPIQPIARPPGTITFQAASNYAFDPGNGRQLLKDGTWFRDAQGRYVLLRGVNFGSRSKRPPFLPILPLSVTTLDASQVDGELTAVRPSLDGLRRLGVNVVRLLVIWKAVEPTPNGNLEQLLPAGRAYLTMLRKVIDELYFRDGIFVILDFHQDIAHEVYGGDGFPDWAMGIDAAHPRPIPPADFKNAAWGLLYYDNPTPGYNIDDDVRNTLQSFWKNSLTNTEAGLTNFPVRTHLEKTIGRVAEFFKDHPGVIGYEPFNEPHPVGFAKTTFEREILPTYYRNVAMEIGRFDDKAFVFIEPRMDWTTYEASATESIQNALRFTHSPVSFLDATGFGPAQSRLVFSFHFYDPWLLTPIYSKSMQDQAVNWPATFGVLRQAADSRNLIPFMTEFGCSQDWQDNTDLRPTIYGHRAVRACLDLQYQQIEAKLLNATIWNFDLYSTASGKDNWNLENFSLLGPGRVGRELDIVARPYPMRSSAKPQQIFFDLESKTAGILLSGAVVDAPTVIFVPRTVHYPGDDFEVRATTPASSVSWDEARQLLYWFPDKNRTQNQIIISKVGDLPGWEIPSAFRALLPQTTFRMIVGRQKPTPVLPPAALTVDVVAIASTATTRTVKIVAVDANTGAPVVGTVTINGVVVGKTGEAVTYSPRLTTITDTLDNSKGKPTIRVTQHVESSQGVVTAPGYPPVSFTLTN